MRVSSNAVFTLWLSGHQDRLDGTSRGDHECGRPVINETNSTQPVPQMRLSNDFEIPARLKEFGVALEQILPTPLIVMLNHATHISRRPGHHLINGRAHRDRVST